MECEFFFKQNYDSTIIQFFSIENMSKNFYRHSYFDVYNTNIIILVFSSIMNQSKCLSHNKYTLILYKLNNIYNKELVL